MELLSGDLFPDQITPFPETIPELLYPQEPLNPIQKLKPIRFAGTPTPAYQDMCQRYAVTGSCGDCSEFVKSEPVAELVGFNRYDDGSGRDCSGFGSGSKDVSSSSLEEEEDDLKTDVIESIYKKSEGHLPKKRKKKGRMRRELELFLENLVMQVMDKQEKVYNQLIEMIEKREKDRLIRVEAWQRQEMERIKKNEELREQELSRNRALISLIENILGDEIPQHSKTLCRGKD